ncbi:class 1 isoprenoid biosynthesis enzyme [Pyxidicoccus xibeiensis]|uniref:class 1 isoprenoid biosynthesis enzyme n=1 Tax=Pyxidicoccus xibeiensis TaxID=2906759 RepID=UPI0020A7FACB|nr:class 1 isoprenoid biosynthesis enzyme [Pyxidicoccus xibeiensis]MCP3137303.1 class 1 isoprenoid biosynthesis enzyme [Pyxidicoccus xibeiensis]
MGDCDLEYRDSVSALPADLRPLAAELPFHLGLTARRDGGWEEYTALAPFQALPGYAAEDAMRPALPPDVLARYLRAHRRGGFIGLFLDRLADGQVQDRPEWPRLRACLLGQWEQALAEATGSAALATQAVSASLRAWDEGMKLEQALLARQSLSLPAYMELVSRKVAWLGTASFCLILAHGRAERLPAFRRVFDLLLLSSQCLDDALDHEEDARLNGISFPAALGYPPGGLQRAAPRVARLGADVARSAGFLRLGGWLAERAAKLDGIPAPGNALQNELAALVLGEAVAGLCGPLQQDLPHGQG